MDTCGPYPGGVILTIHTHTFSHFSDRAFSEAPGACAPAGRDGDGAGALGLRTLEARGVWGAVCCSLWCRVRNGITWNYKPSNWWFPSRGECCVHSPLPTEHQQVLFGVEHGPCALLLLSNMHFFLFKYIFGPKVKGGDGVVSRFLRTPAAPAPRFGVKVQIFALD